MVPVPVRSFLAAFTKPVQHFQSITSIQDGYFLSSVHLSSECTLHFLVISSTTGMICSVTLLTRLLMNHRLTRTRTVFGTKYMLRLSLVY